MLDFIIGFGIGWYIIGYVIYAYILIRLGDFTVGDAAICSLFGIIGPIAIIIYFEKFGVPEISNIVLIKHRPKVGRVKRTKVKDIF